MEDGGLTTGEAAQRLHTTKPTIVNLIHRGELAARPKRHGSRDWWVIDPDSVERFLNDHGPFQGRRRTRPPLEDRTASTALTVELERDTLRARVVALEDALARQRYVTDLLRQADGERATVVEHLLAAAQAAERADDLRRRAHAELEEAVAGFTRPGSAADLV